MNQPNRDFLETCNSVVPHSGDFARLPDVRLDVRGSRVGFLFGLKLELGKISEMLVAGYSGKEVKAMAPRKYSQFQQWDEGIAFYTEYKMAQMVANADFQSTPHFRALPQFKTYRELWEGS